jgi:hypothetical protein
VSRWFRVYDEMLDDAKVQRLPPILFKAWVNLLALTSRSGGNLPDVSDIAFALRSDEETVNGWLDDLEARGLLDEDENGTRPHNWNARQHRSDSDPTAAERQARKRARDKELSVTDASRVTSHPPDTDTEADTKTEKKEREESRADAAQPLAPVKKSHSSEDLAKLRFKALGVPDDLLADFIRLRKAKKLPLTDTAALGLIDKFQQAGMTETEGIRTCIERGWGGFNPEWLKDKTPLRIVANGPRF